MKQPTQNNISPVLGHKTTNPKHITCFGTWNNQPKTISHLFWDMKQPTQNNISPVLGHETTNPKHHLICFGTWNNQPKTSHLFWSMKQPTQNTISPVLGHETTNPKQHLTCFGTWNSPIQHLTCFGTWSNQPKTPYHLFWDMKQPTQNTTSPVLGHETTNPKHHLTCLEKLHQFLLGPVTRGDEENPTRTQETSHCASVRLPSLSRPVRHQTDSVIGTLVQADLILLPQTAVSWEGGLFQRQVPCLKKDLTPSVLAVILTCASYFTCKFQGHGGKD